MSLLATLVFALPAMAAAPLLDVGIHGYTGAAGGLADPMGPDVPVHVGFSAMGWVTRDIGVGLRVDGGTYGILSEDTGNVFPFLEGQYRLGPDWSAGLGVGTPLIWIDYACYTAAPCGDGLWEQHHPIVALDATRELEFGLLHLPLSLRAEVSRPRWAVGVELGVGLRVHRRS